MKRSEKMEIYEVVVDDRTNDVPIRFAVDDIDVVVFFTFEGTTRSANALSSRRLCRRPTLWSDRRLR